MWRVVIALASVGVISPSFCQNPAPGFGDSKAMAAPELPYLDRGACPFEGCIYREWMATKTVVVYDTWEAKRKPIARLSVGEKVTGVTGVVITFKPGTIRIDRDLPQMGLKRGDTILTYSYRGEGSSAVWFKGRYYSDFDITFARADGKPCSDASCAATYIDIGMKSWWAEVKLKSGRMGWVEMDKADFDGVDQLARLGHRTMEVSLPPLRSPRG